MKFLKYLYKLKDGLTDLLFGKTIKTELNAHTYSVLRNT